jgi:hypothetical protein
MYAHDRSSGCNAMDAVGAVCWSVITPWLFQGGFVDSSRGFVGSSKWLHRADTTRRHFGFVLRRASGQSAHGEYGRTSSSRVWRGPSPASRPLFLSVSLSQETRSLGAPITREVATSSPLGTFRRTCKTPCSFLISAIPKRMIDPTGTAALSHSRPHCAGRCNESQRMNVNATAAPISSPIPPTK